MDGLSGGVSEMDKRVKVCDISVHEFLSVHSCGLIKWF